MAEINYHNSQSEGVDEANNIVGGISDDLSCHMEEQSVEQLEQDLTQMLMPGQDGDYSNNEDAFIAINAHLSDSSQARED